MKKIYIVTLLSMILISCTSTSQEKNNLQEQEIIKIQRLIIGPEDFLKKLESEDSPQLIDVRTPQEFKTGSILNAKNLNILDGTLENKLGDLDKTKPIYVYCAKGGRSNKAANLLEKQGFTTIIDLKGGYSDYSKMNEK